MNSEFSRFVKNSDCKQLSSPINSKKLAFLYFCINCKHKTKHSFSLLGNGLLFPNCSDLLTVQNLPNADWSKQMRFKNVEEQVRKH